MASRLSILFLLVSLSACAASGGDPADAGGLDARPRWDTGPRGFDAGGDGGRAVDSGRGSDAALAPDAAPDAGPGDAGVPPVDSGPAVDGGAVPSIVVDGVVGDAEWAGASSVAGTVVTDWGVGLNELRRLRAWVDATDLYVAVEGALEPAAANVIVLYVDRSLGGPDGVADPRDLSDGAGALDDALSAAITTPAAFRADYAWGTRDLDRAASGFDDRMGWRDVASNPADFGWVDSSVAPTVCSLSACETRIPLATLGAGAGGTLALFARLTNTDGSGLSNQTLPPDDPAMPATVTRLLELHP